MADINLNLELQISRRKHKRKFERLFAIGKYFLAIISTA
jgi:hypothetical protein